ncbi:MAG TPA: hypothetical protein DEQ43_06430, partial [Nocardioides bacterium]|nr:hypothetical protein [Nocardioides sp.]
LIARETACLALEQRLEVDRQLAGDADRLEEMGERELVGAARDLASKLDPAAVAARRARAEADRHTTLRPAPDVMTWFGALLPVKDGVAVHKALLDAADRAKCAGDTRSRGAIMADTLVQRVLAPHLATTTGPAELPLVIHVVVPDTVLLGDSDGSGEVEGYGSVPGDLLREWIAAHAEQGVADWITKLYRSKTGELVAMEKGVAGSSTANSPSSSGSGTDAAAPSGATPRSATSTTSKTTPTADRRVRPTAKGPARNATTPNKPSVGRQDHAPAPSTPSRPPHPPDTPTCPAHPPRREKTAHDAGE